jgi:hypothetical protein
VKLIADLEVLLQQQIAEHRKLLAFCDAQQAAMKGFNLKQMEDLTHLTEACRLRIATAENKRRVLTVAINKTLKLPLDAKLPQIAAAAPQFKPSLLKLRDELRAVMEQIQKRNYITSRVAGAVLGHLNTVVRLISGAVEKAGLYTKQGVPKVSARIGVMEAVG